MIGHMYVNTRISCGNAGLLVYMKMDIDVDYKNIHLLYVVSTASVLNEMVPETHPGEREKAQPLKSKSS